MDQLSKLSFVFLQKRITSAETVLVKQSFKCFTRDHGVKILHYHADNGRFADNGFIQACKDNNQGLTYCGVNTHFQNGVAEKRIRDLQEQARTILLFAVHKWPQMLSTALWPYALQTANEVRNATPVEGQTKTQMGYLHKLQSPQSSSTSTPSDVQLTSWTTSYKETKPYKSGKQDLNLAFIRDHHQITHDQSVSY